MGWNHQLEYFSFYKSVSYLPSHLLSFSRTRFFLSRLRHQRSSKKKNWRLNFEGTFLLELFFDWCFERGVTRFALCTLYMYTCYFNSHTHTFLSVFQTSPPLKGDWSSCSPSFKGVIGEITICHPYFQQGRFYVGITFHVHRIQQLELLSLKL